MYTVKGPRKMPCFARRIDHVPWRIWIRRQRFKDHVSAKDKSKDENESDSDGSSCFGKATRQQERKGNQTIAP